MRGQISLDLVLTVLVLGAFLQILMGLGADLVQGQASASLNHQARALLGDVEGRLMAGQGVGPSLSLEGTLPRLRDPETGSEKLLGEWATLQIILVAGKEEKPFTMSKEENQTPEIKEIL